MPSSDLPYGVDCLFKRLEESHYFRIEEPQQSGSFDQMCQIAESATFTVRFVRDRGDEFLEVGFGDEMFSIGLLQFMLLEREPVASHLSLQEAAAFLMAHARELEVLFSPENREESVRKLHGLRVQLIRVMFPIAFVGADQSDATLDGDS